MSCLWYMTHSCNDHILLNTVTVRIRNSQIHTFAEDQTITSMQHELQIKLPRNSYYDLGMRGRALKVILIS